MKPVRILSTALEAMLEHSRREFPLECCGLLSGSGPELIDAVVAATNAKESRRAFEVPATELFQFFRGLRADRRHFLGIYHSHPASPPRPSQRDAEEFHYPGVSYWIISMMGAVPEVRCFDWRAQRFEEVEYAVLDA